MEPETEIDQLAAEQKVDDTPYVRPEFPNQVSMPIEEIDHFLGVEPDGEIISFEHANRPRGSVLTGSATWHGTYGGYTRRKCRCKPCTAANTEYRQKRRKNGAA